MGSCLKNKLKGSLNLDRQNTKTILTIEEAGSKKDLEQINIIKTERNERVKNCDEFIINPEEKKILKKSSNNFGFLNRIKRSFLKQDEEIRQTPTIDSLGEEPKENDLKNKVFSLEKEIKEITEKLKENEDIKKKYSSIESKYEAIKQNYSFFQKENENIKKNNDYFQNTINELVKNDTILQKFNEELQNKNKEIISKNMLLEEEIKKLSEENLSLKKVPILVGLNNIGGNYYMNATLQCLSNTGELTEYFLNKFNNEPYYKNKNISNEYFNVIKNLWDRKNDNKSFSPKEFKETLSRESPLFSGIGNNISKDLINFLLDRIHIELNHTKKENNVKINNYISFEFDQSVQFNEQATLNIFKNKFKKEYNSIISKLFFGISEIKSQCQNCKYFKYNFEVYNFIEFPLERVNQYCFNTGKRLNYNMYNNKNPDIDLYECFEFHSKIESMTGDSQMFCNRCKSNCDFLYCSSLYSTPKYLIINLFRGRGLIYECNVNFPEKLFLFNFVSDKNNNAYELYGVISQIDDPDSMSGSFIAFCKNKIDKKWYKYNDDVITLCEDSDEFRTGMPHILFYKDLFIN